MKSTAAASRYATSLLDLVIEQKNIDSVAGDMNFLLEVYENTEEFRHLISSPIVKAEKKIEIFNRIFDHFEDVTKAFLRLITKNRREDILAEIAFAFEAKVKEHKGIFPVKIVSAAKLDDSVKTEIINKISNAIPGTAEITEEMDEKLIGGFVVQMGDMQVDASVQSQLNKLKQSLTR